MTHVHTARTRSPHLKRGWPRRRSGEPLVRPATSANRRPFVARRGSDQRAHLLGSDAQEAKKTGELHHIEASQSQFRARQRRLRQPQRLGHDRLAVFSILSRALDTSRDQNLPLRGFDAPRAEIRPWPFGASAWAAEVMTVGSGGHQHTLAIESWLQRHSHATENGRRSKIATDRLEKYLGCALGRPNNWCMSFLACLRATDLLYALRSAFAEQARFSASAPHANVAPTSCDGRGRMWGNG